MKNFRSLRLELNEQSFLDKFISLFRGENDKPLDRSRNVLVRSKDVRHKTVGVTVMLKKHKEHRAGREAYDWTLKEPGTGKRYFGTLKKSGKGGWIVLGLGKKSNPQVEISNHGDSLKAIKKIYKILAKQDGTTTSSYPLISRGNASSRPLTN